MGPFDYDRYLVDQLVRPIANLYRVTPLAAGETPAGRRSPTSARRSSRSRRTSVLRRRGGDAGALPDPGASWLDTGGSRYDVVDAQDGKIGLLEHVFGKSLLRSTWRVSDAAGEEVAVARERSQAMAILRRVIDFVPDIGGLIPIPYNFDILARRAGDREDGPEVQAPRPVRARSLRRPERKLDRRLAIALAIGLDTLQNR